MWRRFSWSATDSNNKPQLSQTAKDIAPQNDTATATAVESATPLNAPPTTAAQKPTVTSPSAAATASAVKEHDLPHQRPTGWGQRRRSSIMERLARESTKEEQNMIHYLP